MLDEVLAAEPLLALVRRLREPVRALDLLQVGLRVVLADDLQQRSTREGGPAPPGRRRESSRARRCSALTSSRLSTAPPAGQSSRGRGAHRRPVRSRSVVDQREELVPGELVPAVQEVRARSGRRCRPPCRRSAPPATPPPSPSRRSPGRRRRSARARPAAIASLWISRSPCRTRARTPRATVSHGSLPSLRTGTNPAPKWYATGEARMNPRASIPTTLSTLPRPKCTTIRSMIGRERDRVGQERA